VPDASVDVIGTRAVAELSSIAADNLVPLLLLNEPDGSGKETGSDHVQEAGRCNKEGLKPGHRSTSMM
jgi:hypothetical protein